MGNEEIIQKIEAMDKEGKKIDLRGADLSGLELSEAQLVGADLSQTDLSGVDLSAANLNGANLLFIFFRNVRKVVNVRKNEPQRLVEN